MATKFMDIAIKIYIYTVFAWCHVERSRAFVLAHFIGLQKKTFLRTWQNCPMSNNTVFMPTKFVDIAINIYIYTSFAWCHVERSHAFVLARFIGLQ